MPEEEHEPVGPSVEVPESAVGSDLHATFNGPTYESQRLVAVPFLRARRSRNQRKNRSSEEPEVSHYRPISLSHNAAATAVLTLLLSSCSDLTFPSHNLLTIAELIVLSQQANAPAPPSTSFWVSNSRQSAERINHPDNFNTLYVELTFPARSLASLDGVPLADADSVYVTVDPRPGRYGFTLSPSGIVFSSGASPTAAFSFSVYGDASAGNTSSTYANNADFVAALEIWREVTADQWQITPGSGPAGTDAVRATVESSGRFVLAAPR